MQQQQLEPPSHDELLTNHDEPTIQGDDELEICAQRLRRYRSREQRTGQKLADFYRPKSSSQSRPDPEEFPCQDSTASTEHRGNCKSRPSTPQDDHKSLEPEEEEQDQHTQRRPRRSRKSSNARNTARRSSFTHGVNGHQVPPPPPPPPLKFQRQNSAPDLYCPALPQAEQLLNSVATHKSKVSHVIVKPRLDDDTISTLSFMPNHINTIVNPRQDGDTVSTLTFMDKTSSVIPQRQIPRDPQGQPMHDVNELPLPVKTDGTVISSHSSTYEEDMKQPSVNANTNNYDKKGRCVVHPHIQLRKKKFLKRLSIGASSDKCNSEGGGWKILLSACPECCVDELRRTQQALVATQQQQLCQSVASNQGVTEHRQQQQQATPSSGRVATLDMLHRLPNQDGVRALHSSSPHSSSNAPSLHSLVSIDPPSSDHQGSMTRSSSAGSNCVPLLKKIDKHNKKKLARRPTDETASLTVSSSSCSRNDQQKQHNSSATTSTATSSFKSSSMDSKREKSKSFQRSNSSVGSKGVLSSSTPPSPGQRGTINVSQMQWTNPKNNQPGEYTGQVDHNFVPHGYGVMMYSDPSLRAKGGEWENGKYRRSKHDGRSGSSRKSGSRASKSSSHTHKSRRSLSKNRRGTM